MPFRQRAVYTIGPAVGAAGVMATALLHAGGAPVAAAPATHGTPTPAQAATATAAFANTRNDSSSDIRHVPSAPLGVSSTSPQLQQPPDLASQQPPQQQQSKSKNSDSGGFKHMLAGAVAGMTSKTILQPLDLVKVRLQVQDGRGKNEYKGLRDGLVSIFRSDGFLGLYRGLAPNLMASGVSWGVYFFSYNHAKNFWRANFLHSDASALAAGAPAPRLGPLAHLGCAAFSGTCATLFTNPFSMVKTRLQLQGKEVSANGRVYHGVLDAFTRIVREEGFATLYRGIGPSLVLVSNGALQFMSYEELKRLTVTHLIASHEERELHAAHFLAMGALAKVFSATVTYPMAVTRARLYQRQPDDMVLKKIERGKPVPALAAAALVGGPNGGAAAAVPSAPLPPPHKQVDGKYQGMLDVISKIWRGEGWKGFYRGLTPMLIKTAPSSAMTFLIYETTIKLLQGEPQQKKKKFE